MSRPRVAVLGPHIVDVLGRPVEAIPAGQGSARLTEIRATAAGTAAGTAVDLAKLGASVSVFGAIGADLLGEILLMALAGYQIDTSGLVRKNGAQTSATILPIRPSGERPAWHVPGATRLLELADLELARLAECDAMLLGGPDAMAGLTAGDLTSVVAAAKQAGGLVAVDVLHPGSEHEFARICGALAGADWFWPNSDQLRALTGRADLDLAIADVLALGTGGVAVTLGGDGCLVTAGGGLIHIPAIEVAVVDTTGCGDGFNAGMLTGLLLGCDEVDAAWLGVACGSLVATGLGSDAGLRDLAHAVEILRTSNAPAADRIEAAALSATAATAAKETEEHVA
ncbi:MAG TPA: PfkB family carbohydrate kinase [Streptosporangiaceae bacterium]|nr:PfkB family carbohydrate kinase [Streptosporangiaceae bacterium]